MDKDLHCEDLKHVCDWLKSDKIEVELKILPIKIFAKQIEEMEGTFLEFPEDEERVDAIFNLIQQGDIANPVYVEQGDSQMFIMEGRHRIVAFHRANLKEIEVCFCKAV